MTPGALVQDDVSALTGYVKLESQPLHTPPEAGETFGEPVQDSSGRSVRNTWRA